MTQIFRPSLTLAIKLLLLGIIFSVPLAVITIYRSASGPAAIGEPLQQPIPFSHKHHVRDDGIDCRYCHTSVENASFAGIPSTDICMSCHSQLFTDSPILEPLRKSARTGVPVQWQRVHDLPDFVYFDHSIHINKGVGCTECHGEIDRMPLTWRTASLEMQWCLACHRNPTSHIRPKDKVFDMHWRKSFTDKEQQSLVDTMHILNTRRLTDCSTCHR